LQLQNKEYLTAAVRRFPLSCKQLISGHFVENRMACGYKNVMPETLCHFFLEHPVYGLYIDFLYIFTGVNAARDIYRLVATLLVLFRIFGWSRTTVFDTCFLQSVLRFMELRCRDAASVGTIKAQYLTSEAAARYCLQVDLGCTLGDSVA